MLHEVFFEHTERLGNSLADSDAWHNDDKLRPAVEFVEFKHRFDIDISLACTGFHLDIEVDGAEAVYPRKGLRKRYTCGSLHRVEIF